MVAHRLVAHAGLLRFDATGLRASGLRLVENGGYACVFRRPFGASGS